MDYPSANIEISHPEGSKQTRLKLLSESYSSHMLDNVRRKMSFANGDTEFGEIVHM